MTEEFEIIGEDTVTEAKRVWAKRGKKLKRMIRCTSGKKKGRTVASVGACSKAIDVKKRFKMKRIRKRFNAKIVRKARRTKQFNPLSKRLKTMNKTANKR
jgi:hypothetical protein